MYYGCDDQNADNFHDLDGIFYQNLPESENYLPNGNINFSAMFNLNGTYEIFNADLPNWANMVSVISNEDIDGDGLDDIVTGKRRWAHGISGDVEPNAPPVLYWFGLQRNDSGEATFVPHLIDNDSGVGTQVTTADLNNDGRPDIIVANKHGVFAFRQQ